MIILNESKVIESIKNVCSKSAGSSMKIKIAAYNLLEYVSSSKGNYKKTVDRTKEKALLSSLWAINMI